jgi:tRNA modification GTPase
MHFNHRPYQKGETIAAIATPPGEGAIAVIRVSGDLAVAKVAKVFSGPIHSFTSHMARLGRIISLQGEMVDEVVVIVMRAPKSYTAEETVEIHCHGGSLITRRVFETILSAGVRSAMPGEFTARAFLNGKIDLSQAEAIQEIISAKNDLALKAAENHLQGALSKKITFFQKQLVDIAAHLEAWVDFPEEGIEFSSMDTLLATLNDIKNQMSLLCNTFHEGKIMKEGLSLCLAGSPNVGKSSLMNALLGKNRAIVTDIPGTTRDLLEADLRLGDLHFTLFDTAGIRETEEVIEKEGIKRSRQAMETADLILLVLDSEQGISSQDQELLKKAPRHKTIVVWNKIDMASSHEPPKSAVSISAKEGTGLHELTEAIEKLIWKKGPPSKEEVVITTQRHQEALKRGADALSTLITGLENGVSPEFLASDMRVILTELGTIIGVDISEEILSAIFSKFCVGK